MKDKYRLLRFFAYGVLTALPYVFRWLWLLSYVSLIPMICELTETVSSLTKKRAYLLGFVFGMGYFGTMFHWFTEFYPMDFAGVTKGTAIALVAVCWIGLALIQALEFGAVTLAFRLVSPRKDIPLAGGLLFTALWVIFEWQQTFFWRGVPWARLAITQSAAPLALQSASLFGGLFVSGLIVAVNALLAVAVRYALDRLKNSGFSVTGALKNKKTVIFASVALGICVLNFAFGAIRILTYKDENVTPVKAAVIQANISSLDKWGVSANKSLNIYLELTEKCVKETGAELVVWPESVIPAPINLYPQMVTRIAQKADELDITLFVGAFEMEKGFNENGGRDEYNAVYLFYPDGKTADHAYRKRRLVPFGEYTPMEELIMTVLPVLDTFNLFNNPLTAGEGTQLFETEYGKVGSLICFDSIYDYLSADSVADGAELITLSTNDSWFSDSAAVYQHNNHGRLRAIETGRYIIRAASTGVSSVFSPTGETLAEIPPLTEGYTCAEVYPSSSGTLYGQIGNVFVYICIGYVSCIAANRVAISINRKK